MSYMFELFDIVAGARRASRAQSIDQRQHLENPTHNETNTDGGPMPTTDISDNDPTNSDSSSSTDGHSDTEVGNEDGMITISHPKREKKTHHPIINNNNKPPRLNLTAINNSVNSNNNSNSSLGSNTSPRNAAVLDSPIENKSTTSPRTPKSPRTFSIHAGDIELDIVVGSKDKDGADETPTPGELKDDELGHSKEFKVKESYFQWKYLKGALGYHAFHLLIVAIVTLVCCLYISFYVTFGSHYINVPYEEWPLWSKVSWVITGIVNEQFLHSMGFAIIRSQYGHKLTKCLIPYHVVIALLSAAFEIYSRVTRLQGSVLYIPKYMLALADIILISYLFGYKVLKKKFFVLWFSLPFLFMAVFLIIYDYSLLPFFLKKSTTEITRSVIRILIHPAITAVCLLVSRFCANMIKDYDIPPRSILSLTLIPIVFNTFYGRFFGNSMGTLLGVTISSLVLSFTDLFWKCSLRARDSFIVKYLCRCSKNASVIMKHNLPIYAEYQSFDLIFEISSNFISTFLIITYYLVYSPSELDIGFQFKVMAIQLAFSLGTEIVVSYVENGSS
ncbi:hypothetical protein PPL_02401 [Heterostelium album PN500]|uniref:Uncharacterized protein n=1 Tax=Heterostelium pallidum (strain ATCC 26659 / Pp 5 / PN500) TaxID=670386 RepID=D3AZL9_HETP5|nr:hypothetical protein PPL_02401 [Heterostelium album PN500]EFA85398.1 hypothetical protein PPL_02401 [Heterostelium album PN500]|eukprot:XP_020437507.1 hypothetical protein PPL_02401 [Heterostelium album PN500]